MDSEVTIPSGVSKNDPIDFGRPPTPDKMDVMDLIGLIDRHNNTTVLEHEQWFRDNNVTMDSLAMSLHPDRGHPLGETECQQVLDCLFWYMMGREVFS